MKTIYLDSDFRCHITPAEGLTPMETSFFDGKCDAYIQGYRLVPEGMTWTREDGRQFRGEMAAPWRDHAILCAYQQQYAQMLPELNDMQTALATLGVSVDG